MISTNTLITIVVPVYNVSPYIDECISSIVNQDYINLEIILINDGSTDDSLQKCIAWTSKDKRISYYTQNNRGLSAARNKGVELAHGRCVSFIDPDDIVESNFISTLYSSICEKNSDISVVYLDIMGQKKSFIQTDAVKTYSGFEAMNLLCDGKIPVSSCDKLYKIELLRKVSFIEGLLYEDNPFTYQIISRCGNVAVCEKILYHHRMRNGSITHTISPKNFYDHNKAMNLVADCISNYYSDTNYRFIAKCLENWFTTENLYRKHYKKILSRQERTDIQKEQRELRRYILSNASKERTAEFSTKVKMKFFAMKYIPDLYYPLYKVYHVIKTGNRQ